MIKRVRAGIIGPGIILAALCVASSAAPAEEAKLDAGLDAADRSHPIFVRMKNQLFPRGGAYEAFSRQPDHGGRQALRRRVLQTLKDKNGKSWASIAPLVQKLASDGSLRSVQRYWIVNGFAGEATAAACRALAAEDEVAFVYRQPVPYAPLHRRPLRARADLEQQHRVHRAVMAAWRDDSDDRLKLEGTAIPWNLKRIGADTAWKAEGATGRGVVVAVLDSGLMLAPGLLGALWRNPQETLDGRDEDGNGYVDDIFGYNFAAGSGYVLGDGRIITHGSTCAGIIAGRPLNRKRLITGVAPRAQVMVLRGSGDLRAYQYLADNGADVLSMSYMWVGVNLGHYRGLYRLAHEHLAAAGVVAVGGAGNFAAGPKRQPPGRQIALPKDIPCVIAVAGILENGSRSPSSSQGPCVWKGVKFYDDYPADAPLAKPDVTACFGGFPVWGRTLSTRHPQLRYKLLSDEGNGRALISGPQGNSYAGPHAAGVAALILSANPDLHPWQVKDLMEATARDLGPAGRDPQFGAGLLDAAAAVRAAKSRLPAAARPAASVSPR